MKLLTHNKTWLSPNSSGRGVTFHKLRIVRNARLSRIDPSRTTMIRRRFVAEMNRRFMKIRRTIKRLVVRDDAFGLVGATPMTLQERQLWRFRTDAGKVTAYRDWLQKEMDVGILTVDPASGEPWTSRYVSSSYRKGVTRGYTDANKTKLVGYEGTREDFLREAFGVPETLSKIELISTRVFEELKGVTAAMSQQMSRTLAEGLAAGRGPAAIARDLQERVTGITRKRARVLARTEVIHAHAEGQLDAFERLGVEEVGIMAELSTAGDDRVCAECGATEGEVMTVKEARGMIPLHPNCRCAWVPVPKPRKVRRERAPLEELPTEERLLRVKDSFIGTVDDDYTKLFDAEFIRLNVAFPKVAKRLRSVQTLKHKKYVQRFGKDSLANAGRETDKNWRIFFDGRYFGKRAKYDLKAALKSYKKRKILTSNEIQHTLTHEYGHLVHRTLKKSQRKKIHDLWWDEFIDKGAIKIEKQIGKYAATSSAEMFAESFVQHQAGKMTAWSRKVMKIAKIPKVKTVKVIEVLKPMLRPKMKVHVKNAYNKAQQRTWERNLTKKEKKFIRGWVNGGDTFGNLRLAIAGKKPGMYADIIRDWTAVERKQAVTIWNAAMGKSPLYKGDVYRALGFGSKSTIKTQFRIGKKLKFNFTQSASRDIETSMAFLENADYMNQIGVMLRVKSKTGTYLGKQSLKNIVGYAGHQEEVLLHFNTQYKINAVKYIKDIEFSKGGYYLVNLIEL